MLVVETIAKIQRRHLGAGESIRSIARSLGVSRNTVRKVVRGGATEHRYDRGAAQPRPKLDGFIPPILRVCWRPTRRGVRATV